MSIIETIKAKINVVDEIGLVVALQKSGKALKGLCTFHNERTPSFYVFAVKTRSKHAKQMLSKSVCVSSMRTRCYGSIKCCCAQKRRLRLAHTSRAAASRRIRWLPLALVTHLNSGTAYRVSCWDEDIPSENWSTADLRGILTEGWAAVVAGSMITSGIA